MPDELISKWDEIKESIRIEYEVPDISYKTWIEPLKLGEIKNNTVYIETPKELAQSIFIINKKFYTPFKIYINEALGKSFEDQYEIAFFSVWFHEKIIAEKKQCLNADLFLSIHYNIKKICRRR